MSPRALTIAVAIGCIGPVAARAAQAQMSPQDLHDRIVAVFSSRASRPLPPGDTLVSWYGNPILFHTIHRDSTETATGMLRADSLLGTARVRWRHDRPGSGDIRWTKGDSLVTNVHLLTDGDTLRVMGRDQHTWPLPRMAWAIADYGMEDQVLPLLQTLNFAAGAITIAVYRPFGAKLDTLQVTSRLVGDGVLYELRGSDGKRDWWLVSRRGVLVQLRREGQDLERRPLEQTPLYEEYRLLLALVKE